MTQILEPEATTARMAEEIEKLKHERNQAAMLERRKYLPKLAALRREIQQLRSQKLCRKL